MQVLEIKDVLHEETLAISGDLKGLEVKIPSTTSETPVPEPEVIASAAPAVATPVQVAASPVPVPPDSYTHQTLPPIYSLKI